MFLVTDFGAYHVALVTAFDETSVTVVSGNVLDENDVGHVEKMTFDLDDPNIYGYGSPRYGLMI